MTELSTATIRNTLLERLKKPWMLWGKGFTSCPVCNGNVCYSVEKGKPETLEARCVSAHCFDLERRDTHVVNQ
jgi:hypothetical protein